jgi:peptide-methionine (R)-S-oxide reductase
MDRRNMIASSGGALAILAAFARRSAAQTDRPPAFEVEHSPAEWRQRLTAAQYEVLRLAGTELPGSSPLLGEHRRGLFACAGCNLLLFSSATKFESGTGWPSFFAPLPNAVVTSTYHRLLMQRTEVRCRRCRGHLGHVFDDGPRPTGLRYCMNGVALVFHNSPQRSAT